MKCYFCEKNSIEQSYLGKLVMFILIMLVSTISFGAKLGTIKGLSKLSNYNELKDVDVSDITTLKIINGIPRQPGKGFSGVAVLYLDGKIIGLSTIKNGKNFKIGCGKLLLIGYEPLREYIYGKVEYGTDDIGFGIYQNGDELIYGNGSKEDMTEIEKKYNIELLKKECTGYFVLDLKTGEYQGGLSENEQDEILSDKKISDTMLPTEQFLDTNGKTIVNYEIDNWMEN